MDILKEIKYNRLPKEIICFIDLLNKSVSIYNIIDVRDNIRSYFFINNEDKTVTILKWNIYYYFAESSVISKWNYSEYDMNVELFINNTIYADYKRIWI